MSLFRSEEHITTWLRANGRQHGASVSLQQVWSLAKAWYTDPRSTDWRPRTSEESQAVLTSAGLTGEFWELPR